MQAGSEQSRKPSVCSIRCPWQCSRPLSHNLQPMGTFGSGRSMGSVAKAASISRRAVSFDSAWAGADLSVGDDGGRRERTRPATLAGGDASHCEDGVLIGSPGPARRMPSASSRSSRRLLLDPAHECGRRRPPTQLSALHPPASNLAQPHREERSRLSMRERGIACVPTKVRSRWCA